MGVYVGVIFLALPLGAMYALQASGIVLVYRTTRVFNFAQAGIGVVAAYLAASVAKHTGGGHAGALLGGLVGIAVGAGLGVLIEFTSIRRTRGTLQRTVVTLGWLLALQSLVVAIYTYSSSLEPAAIFSTGKATGLPGTRTEYSWLDLAALVIAAVVAIALGLFLSRSSFGVAMRAVADDPEAGALLGLPVPRVLTVTWALSGAVAGLSGVLIAPLLANLDNFSLFLVTVQAIAVALVARLRSLPVTFAAGLALAVVQQVSDQRFGFGNHVSSLVGFVVVLLAVVLRPSTGRADVSEGGLAPVRISGLPSTVLGLPSIAVGLLVVFLLPLPFNAIHSNDVSQIGAWSIAALSVVLLTGVGGQVSVCQCVFMGVGGVTTAWMSGSTGVPFVLCIVVGMVAAAFAAVVVGVPALRLAPIELAIVTVAFGFAADSFLFRWSKFVGGSHTAITRPSWIASSTRAGEHHYAWFVLGLFFVASLGVVFLRRGRTGAALTALRSSSAATSAMGFSVTSSKLVAFAASGALAGLAGALLSGAFGSASVGPQGTMSTTASITLLAYALIAGVGNVPAAILSGLLVVIPTVSAGGGLNPHVYGLINLVAGLLLVVVLVGLPQGLASVFRFVPVPWREEPVSA